MLHLIVGAVGAISLDWSFKTECGAVSMTLTYSNIVLKLTNNLLQEAVLTTPPNPTTGTFDFSAPFDMGERIAFNFTNEDGDSRLTIFKNVADRIIYLTILPVLLSFYQIRPLTETFQLSL
jgi:hypothetical protein